MKGKGKKKDMGKQLWKPGNMLYPLPVVMVSVADNQGNNNIITIGWVGTVCTNPPMVSISVRPERYSYQMLKESGEFVINLTTKDLIFAATSPTLTLSKPLTTTVLTFGTSILMSFGSSKIIG